MDSVWTMCVYFFLKKGARPPGQVQDKHREPSSRVKVQAPPAPPTLTRSGREEPFVVVVDMASHMILKVGMITLPR